jgi:hypothetical protein
MVTLEQIIATCLMTPRHNPFDPICHWGLPLNIVGLSGGGKSERIASACHAVSLPLQVVFPASKQPEDFGGAPFPTPDGIMMACILPQANKLLEAGAGVLLFDELSTASPRVQGAALGVFNDKRIGDQLLPPRVRMLAAMNPPEYAAGGYPIEAPMANRMMHITYDMPTLREWTDWAMGTNDPRLEHVSNAEQRVLNGWNTHFPQTTGLITGFLGAFPDHLHGQPKPDDADAGGPWPSPRTWNWVIRGLATARSLGMPSDIEPRIVAGLVGDSIMSEWVEWVTKADLPSPIDMLTKNWFPDEHRMDITIAAMTSMTMWVCSINDDPQAQSDYAAAGWGIIDKILEIGQPDVAVRSASAFTTQGLAHESNNPRLAQKAHETILELGRKGYAKFAAMMPDTQ